MTNAIGKKYVIRLFLTILAYSYSFDIEFILQIYNLSHVICLLHCVRLVDPAGFDVH